MRYFLLVMFLLVLPVSLFAKERFNVLSSENVLKLAGECSIDVQVILTPVGENEKTSYSSNTGCIEGKFSFSDDLMQWNLPEGQYTLWVNGDLSTKRVIVKNRVVESIVAESEQSAIASDLPPKNRFEQAINDFGKSLGSMSASLGIIEENLSASDYAGDTVKRVLVGFLRTTLDALGGFFNDLKGEGSIERPSATIIPQEEASPSTEEMITDSTEDASETEMQTGNGEESAITTEASSEIDINTAPEGEEASVSE